MNVRVEAVVMTAQAVINESRITVEHTQNVHIPAPVVSRFHPTHVLSVGGTSISSITPETFLRREKAIA
jgi:hypothetical protein